MHLQYVHEQRALVVVADIPVKIARHHCRLLFRRGGDAIQRTIESGYFADGVYIGVAGLQVFVHYHAAVALQLRRLCQLYVWNGADGHYHGLAGNIQTAFHTDAFQPGLPGEPVYFIIVINIDAPVGQLFIEQLPAQRIELPVHKPRCALYNAYVYIHFLERCRQLYAKQPSAHDHHFAAGRVKVLFESIGIHAGAHGKDAGDRRNIAQRGRAAAGCHHQYIIRMYVTVTICYQFVFPVEMLNAYAAVQGDFVFQLFRPCHFDQLFPLLGAADIIREHYPVIEGKVFFAEHYYFICGVQLAV